MATWPADVNDFAAGDFSDVGIASGRFCHGVGIKDPEQAGLLCWGSSSLGRVDGLADTIEGGDGEQGIE